MVIKRTGRKCSEITDNGSRLGEVPTITTKYYTKMKTSIDSILSDQKQNIGGYDQLRVLVGCEESQTVTKAFRKLGVRAFSCDLQPCSGGNPEWHLQMDVFEAIEIIKPTLGIFHPPCDFLSKAGARWMYPTKGNVCPIRLHRALNARDFFMKLLNANIEHIAVENPMPLRIVNLPKPGDVIQPFQHGHPFSKKTYLWLKNLPPLMHTNYVSDYKPFMPSNTGGKKRGQKATFVNITKKNSSKTFDGIAEAMAVQWTDFLLKTNGSTWS